MPTIVFPALVLFLILSFMLPGSRMTAQDWLMANHDRERSGFAREETFLYPPLQSRIITLPGDRAWSSGLTYREGTLYASLETDGAANVVSIDGRSGTQIWSYEMFGTKGTVNVAPALTDTLVFCGGQAGLGLYALHRLTGTRRWFLPVGALYSCNPIIDGPRLYIVSDSLRCIELSTGTPLWASYLPAGRTSPAVDDQQVYVCVGNKAFAFDKFTGAKRWEAPNSQDRFSSVGVDQQYVFTYHQYAVVARRKTDGSIAWSHPLTGEVAPTFTSSFAFSGNILCAAVWKDTTGKGVLRAMDQRNGAFLWEHIFPKSGPLHPVIAREVVYVISPDSTLWAFDIYRGTILFTDHSANFCDAPIVADHELYAGAEGKIVVYTTIVTDAEAVPPPASERIRIIRSYPNPFSGETRFDVQYQEGGPPRVQIVDLLGRVVREPAPTSQSDGRASFRWDGRDALGGVLPGGIYFVCATGVAASDVHPVLKSR